MTTLREAAQAVVDRYRRENAIKGGIKIYDALVEDLIDALAAAEPTQEPVAWMREGPSDDNYGVIETWITTMRPPPLSEQHYRPLYAHPAPPQTPMTDEQIDALWDNEGNVELSLAQLIRRRRMIRMAEAFHGIGPARGE